MWKKKKYKKIFIPKKDWTKRLLQVPVFKLKNAQRLILKKILYSKYSELLISNVTWFIPNKWIKDNALFHVWKKYILKIDIKDFFPSISQDRIYWLFRKEFNFDHENSMYLSSLCTHNNQLPQWAPTSPMLANLIARFLDYRVIWLLKTYNQDNELNLTYSRYADDLTFSFNKKINVNIFINYVISILLEEWFYPNYKKISLIWQWKQQRVTGVIVNTTSSVWRKYYKTFKSIFYNIKKSWFTWEMLRWNEKNENKVIDVNKFKQILKWYLCFIRDISPIYYDKLNKFNLDLSINKIKSDIDDDINNEKSFWWWFNL